MAAPGHNKRSGPTDVVVFRVDGIACGLDILDIQEIKKIHTHAVVHRAPSYVRGLVNMRGQVVTLIDVGERLGFETTPLRAAMPAIIISLGDEYVGLLVDEVDDVIEVDPMDILPPPSNLGGVEGHFLQAVVRTTEGLIALIDKERIAGVQGEVAVAIREGGR